MLTPEKIAEMDNITGLQAGPKPNVSARLAELDALDQTAEAEAKGKTIGGKLDKASAVIGQVGEGLVKSGLGTLQGLSKLGQQVLGKVGLDKGETLFTPEQEESYVKPEGAAQKVGKFAGDVGQFAVPMGGASKVGQGTGLVRRVVGEGLTGGAVTAVQEGGLNKESRDAAILSAVFPVAGKGASTMYRALKSPENGARIVNSLIKPLLKDFSYGKNPGRAVAEEGIVASNLDELATKIGEARSKYGGQIGEMVTTADKANPVKIDVSDAFAALDTSIEQAKKNPRTNAALIQRLESLKDDILQVTDQEGVRTQGRQLVDLSRADVFALKSDISDLTKFTGNASDDAMINKSLKQSYGKLKEKLNQATPGLDKLNEKYADLSSAEIATKYRDKIAERQNLISLTTQNIGVGGALVGAIASGGAAIPAILAGAGAATIKKLLETPKVKTKVAAWLARTTPAERSAFFKAVPALKGAIIQSFVGGEEEL